MEGVLETARPKTERGIEVLEDLERDWREFVTPQNARRVCRETIEAYKRLRIERGKLRLWKDLEILVLPENIPGALENRGWDSQLIEQVNADPGILFAFGMEEPTKEEFLNLFEVRPGMRDRLLYYQLRAGVIRLLKADFCYKKGRALVEAQLDPRVAKVARFGVPTALVKTEATGASGFEGETHLIGYGNLSSELKFKREEIEEKIMTTVHELGHLIWNEYWGRFSEVLGGQTYTNLGKVIHELIAQSFEEVVAKKLISQGVKVGEDRWKKVIVRLRSTKRKEKAYLDAQRLMNRLIVNGWTMEDMPEFLVVLREYLFDSPINPYTVEKGTEEYERMFGEISRLKKQSGGVVK